MKTITQSAKIVLSTGLATILIAAASYARAADKDEKDRPEPYSGFKTDQALIRKQVVLKTGGQDVRTSSGEACQAAYRIFSRVSFLFRTRAEVLEVLGDQGTVSDYNKPAGKDPSSPLVYRFDTGFGGLQYTISFDKQSPPKVDQIRVDGIN